MTDYTLYKGNHTTGDGKRCAMEWVAYLAGEPHSAHPECVHRFLTGYCTTLNDRATDEERQRLRPYLARTIGTAGDGVDRSRIASKLLRMEHTMPHPDGAYAAICAYNTGGMDFALDLLDALLPTVAISPPVVEDADRVCGVC